MPLTLLHKGWEEKYTLDVTIRSTGHEMNDLLNELGCYFAALAHVQCQKVGMALALTANCFL